MSRLRLSAIATAAAVIGSLLVAAPAAQADVPDMTPPTVRISSPIEGQPVEIGGEPLPTVQYTCDDDVEVATCEATVSSADGMFGPIPARNETPLSYGAPGRYVLTVTSSDTSGNAADSSVTFEVGPDKTAPSIEIAAPVDGAQVKKGAVVDATYSCTDFHLESCEGPVASGEQVDTSSLGVKDFAVVARDKAGNESTKTVQYEVIPPASVTVSGAISNQSKQLVPGATVQALWAGTTEVVASTDADANGLYSLTLSEGTYDLRYRGPEGSGIGANLKNRELTADREINVTLGEVPVMLSGVVSDGVTGPVSYGWMSIDSPTAGQAATTSIGPDGSFSVEVLPGEYSFSVQGQSATVGSFYLFKPAEQFTEDTVIDLAPDLVPVTVNLIGADGSDVWASVSLQCATYDYQTGQQASVNGYQRGQGKVQMYGLVTGPGQTCQLRIDPDDGPNINRNIELTTGDNAVDVEIQEGILLSGVVSDGVTGPVSYGWMSIDSPTAGQAATTSIGPDGSFSVEVLPGEYSFSVQGQSATVGSFYLFKPAEQFTEDTVIDLAPDLVPVTVNLIGADGSDVWASVSLQCATYDYQTGQQASVNGYQRGQGKVQMYGLVTGPGQTCQLRIDPDDGPNINRNIEVGQDTELTIFTFGGGIVIDGDTTATNDGDNVADAVEALAPNNGDGNNDGTPDYEQENVTSLPVNGGGLGSGANYVTVAAPTGTQLSNVFTIDPSDTAKIETPPPPNVTLPEGLTNLVLKGVETGTDQTISIFTASTQNVTGYAKYNPNTKQWSLLPDDRVQIFDNRVEITLTDGGIGDDDGEANGRISDPGGIAIVRNLDTVAPTVTGQASSQPNANGWYDNDVTVDWTVDDPEPSSGIAAQPQPTIVTGEGTALTAESALVCDNARNCSTGKVDGIKIDRTKPTIDVSGVTDEETYTLGVVPVASCSASDDLSGLDGACTGTLTGGTSNGVGEFTYEATAKDKAGNERRKIVTYRVVYRFDGFLQPINDPALVPGAGRSVFKSGSTVPVKLQVKRADGSLVDPLTPPEWLTPEKGSATAGTVNEEVWTDPATTGTAFAKTGDQWHYNWKTKGIAAGYTYRIGVKLDDGTKHYVVVAAK